MNRHNKKSKPVRRKKPSAKEENPPKEMYSQSANQLKAYRAKLSSRIERRDRIARIKDEIRRGTYETPEKLKVAVERLLAELIKS